MPARIRTALLAAVSAACLLAPAVAQAPDPKAGRVMPWVEIVERAQFVPVLPNWMPEDYVRVRAEIVWIPKAGDEPIGRGRQAVTVTWRRPETEQTVVLLMSPGHAEIGSHENLQWIVDQGWFRLTVPEGTAIRAMNVNRTDVGLIGRLTDDEARRIQESLRPVPRED